MMTKPLNNKFQLLLFCLLFSLNMTAQTYTPPNQNDVETLIDDIERCKSNIEKAEQQMEKLEADPGNYTYATYKNLQDAINENKKCVAAARKELEKLRKDYPGWFNSPSATVPNRQYNWVTPRELQELLDEVERKMDELLSGFGDLIEPEH